MSWTKEIEAYLNYCLDMHDWHYDEDSIKECVRGSMERALDHLKMTRDEGVESVGWEWAWVRTDDDPSWMHPEDSQ